MKKIIRETESEGLLTISKVELKIIIAILKIMGVKNNMVDIHKLQFINLLINTFAITNEVIVTKMLLFAFYNNISDLELSLKNNNTELLYRGPFYLTTIRYWDDVEEESEFIDVECDECDGVGERTVTCDFCDGYGSNEDVDGEEYLCDECGGEGNTDVTCDFCGGYGIYEQESLKYVTNAYETHIITTHYIIEDELIDVNEILYDSYILKGSNWWVDDYVGFDYDHVNKFVGVTEIIDRDVIDKEFYINFK